MENPNFLKQKYNLHNTPEADSAAKRTKKRTGEKVSQKPGEKIQNYLDRFNEIIERKDPDKKERGIGALKRILHNKFVLKEDEIPQTYYNLQGEIAVEEGRTQELIDSGVEIENKKTKNKKGEEIEEKEFIFPNKIKKELSEVIIADQESTMDNWIDYLSSDDAQYPDWLKYYAFRNMLNLGKYDKERKKFPPRELPDRSDKPKKKENLTTAPFPDLNREALAYVLDAIEKKHKKEGINLEFQDEEEKNNFQKILQGENFAKLYAWAIEKVTPASQEVLETVKGKWIKYDQGTDHMPLVNSLQGHGTGWCTAGESTARTQLQGGDFYVFYSEDENNNPIIPRAAIRMEGQSKIAEVRGIAHEQNLDAHITDTVKEKVSEFGEEGKKYEKKSKDMKHLTEIENKTKNNQELTKDNLIFLYEIDDPIEGFGYQRDLRIEEIRKIRDTEKDASIVFECDSNQIAKNISEINENTEAYIGEWDPSIYQEIRKYPNIKHLYESFPDKKIFKMNLETDPSINSPQTALEALEGENIYLTNWAKDILKETKFSKEKQNQNHELVRFTVKELGFPNGATTKEIYDKLEELGLDLCPTETGPQLRLKYPGKEWMLIAMEPIAGSGGDPRVFNLREASGRLGLDASDAGPGDWWSPGYRFVFRPRKLDS
jgi:hypothetical protein